MTTHSLRARIATLAIAVLCGTLIPAMPQASAAVSGGFAITFASVSVYGNSEIAQASDGGAKGNDGIDAQEEITGWYLCDGRTNFISTRTSYGLVSAPSAPTSIITAELAAKGCTEVANTQMGEVELAQFYMNGGQLKTPIKPYITFTSRWSDSDFSYDVRAVANAWMLTDLIIPLTTSVKSGTSVVTTSATWVGDAENFGQYLACPSSKSAGTVFQAPGDISQLSDCLALYTSFIDQGEGWSSTPASALTLSSSDVVYVLPAEFISGMTFTPYDLTGKHLVYLSTSSMFATWPDSVEWSSTPTPSTYTVTYNLNNATSGTVPNAETVPAGTSYTVAFNSGNLKRTGFRFLGWGDNPSDGSGVNYRPGIDTLTISANTTLYAKWDNPYGFGLFLDKPFVQNSYVYSPTDSATALDSANGYAAGDCPTALAIGTITSGTGCRVEVNGLYGGASTLDSTQTVGGSGTNFFGSRGGGFTVTFPTPQTYFGMWWTGGSTSDTIEFLSGTTVLATMTTSSLATLLSPDGYPRAEASPGGAFPILTSPHLTQINIQEVTILENLIFIAL